MNGKIMDCRELGKALKDQVKSTIDKLKLGGLPAPELVIIQVGDDPASSLYIRNKEKACEYCGIKTRTINLPTVIASDETLTKIIEDLNNDLNVSGIMIQLPLPDTISESVLQKIAPEKDVDCFNNKNIGAFTKNINNLNTLPCTVFGIHMLLNTTNVDLEGKECVVVGRSDIVGKPTANLMTQLNTTVTLCHSKTKNLTDHLRRADIIISAVGKPEFITSDCVKEGAIIIDVGINKNSEGKTCGDVLIDDALLEKVEWVTPVPYGMGQLTVACLMLNTLSLYINRLTPVQ